MLPHELPMASHEPSSANDGMTIFINGSEYQPLKKIASRDQLLDLADLNPKEHEIQLLDEKGGKSLIENNEAVQLQAGMRFLTNYKASE